MDNNISTTFSPYKFDQLSELSPIQKCCIKGCPVTEHLKSFPLKYTKEYNVWLKACKESETNIIFKQNPMICAIHFSDNYTPPSKYLTEETIENFKHDLDRINHCVAEWILFVRNNLPQTKINDEAVLSKSEEIAKIFNLFPYKAEFGWLNIFEKYLQKQNIKSWRRFPKSKKCQIDVKFEFAEDANTKENYAEDSIKTYDEAIKRVEILKKYCKRTRNKSALDVAERLSEVLRNKI